MSFLCSSPFCEESLLLLLFDSNVRAMLNCDSGIVNFIMDDGFWDIDGPSEGLCEGWVDGSLLVTVIEINVSTL